MPTSQPVFHRVLRWGLWATLALLVVFALIGWFVAAAPGLVGGVLGTVMGGVFLALTAGSIAFANRFIEHEAYIGIFFGMVLGAWILKFILFIVVLVLLRDRDWLDIHVFFFGLLTSIIVSLGIDVAIFLSSRVPIDVSLPEDD